MSFVSYAQNFEDVILWRALKHVTSGCYIDIGANDPVNDSVSLAFYEKGWRGIHVEPMRACAEALRIARPNEVVIEAAVSTSKNIIKLTEFENTGLTTGVDLHADRHKAAGLKSKQLDAQPITLSKVLQSAKADTVHWLKIDVEGMEADVLKSWGSTAIRPWIVVVEATLPNSTETNHTEWEEELTRRDYTFAYFDGLNRFYVHNQHQDLISHFGPGPNFFDYFTLSEFSPFSATLKGRLTAALSSEQDIEQKLAHALAQRDTQTSAHAEAIRVAVEAVSAEAKEARARLDEQLSKAHAEHKNSRDHIAQLQTQLSEHQAEISQLSYSLQERTDAMTRAAEEARLNAEQYAQLLRENTNQCAELIQESREQAENLIQMRDAHRAELLEERKAKEAVSAMLTQAQTDRDSALAQATDIANQSQAEIASHKSRTEALYASTSWKISAPVRWAGNGVRGVFAIIKRCRRIVLEAGIRFFRATPRRKAFARPLAKLVPSLGREIDHLRSIQPGEPHVPSIEAYKQWNATPPHENVEAWTETLKAAATEKVTR